MMHVEIEAKARTRFRWGIALAWLPFVFFFGPAAFVALRGMSANKATGVGAVAGGLFEGLATFGLVAIVVSEISAVVLLVRSFSRGHSARGVFSVLSIGCAVFVVGLLGLLIWLVSHSLTLGR